jgi:molybdopterin synthase sulfur carrier subunit
MRVLYFAWVRERVGLAGEEISPPEEVTTVCELMSWLRERGEGYGAAFENTNAVRAALDRTHVRHDAKIDGAREIAFFPPMTGG